MNKAECLEELKKPTNLLNTPKGLRSSLDSQRAFLLRMALLPSPCPSCGVGVTVLDAAPEDWSLESGTEEGYECPHCECPLRHVVPLMSVHPWHWLKKFTPKKEQ